MLHSDRGNPVVSEIKKSSPGVVCAKENPGLLMKRLAFGQHGKALLLGFWFPSGYSTWAFG
jgi:hypothetical protein